MGTKRTFRPLTTTRPLRTSTTAVVQDISKNATQEEISMNGTQEDISKNGTQEEMTDCAGSLTLFSKTYLRGDKAVLVEEEADLANISFDNLSVSASVSGSCCWQIFCEQNYSSSN